MLLKMIATFSIREWKVMGVVNSLWQVKCIHWQMLGNTITISISVIHPFSDLVHWYHLCLLQCFTAIIIYLCVKCEFPLLLFQLRVETLDRWKGHQITHVGEMITTLISKEKIRNILKYNQVSNNECWMPYI